MEQERCRYPHAQSSSLLGTVQTAGGDSLCSDPTSTPSAELRGWTVTHSTGTRQRGMWEPPVPWLQDAEDPERLMAFFSVFAVGRATTAKQRAHAPGLHSDNSLGMRISSPGEAQFGELEWELQNRLQRKRLRSLFVFFFSFFLPTKAKILLFIAINPWGLYGKLPVGMTVSGDQRSPEHPLAKFTVTGDSNQPCLSLPAAIFGKRAQVKHGPVPSLLPDTQNLPSGRTMVAQTPSRPLSRSLALTGSKSAAPGMLPGRDQVTGAPGTACCAQTHHPNRGTAPAAAPAAHPLPAAERGRLRRLRAHTLPTVYSSEGKKASLSY